MSWKSERYNRWLFQTKFPGEREIHAKPDLLSIAADIGHPAIPGTKRIRVRRRGIRQSQLYTGRHALYRQPVYALRTGGPS